MASSLQYQPLCMSFGMIFLDTLHFVDRPSMVDILGGSGTWATFGARLCVQVVKHTMPRAVGCLAVVGDDFPAEILDQLRSWGLTLAIKRLPPGMKSTRGELTYLDKEFGNKTFRYISPPQNPKAEYLADSALLGVRAIHMFGAPVDVHRHLTELAALRPKAGVQHDPIIVYEPIPFACIHAQIEEMLDVARRVDVMSPNHLELLRLCEEDFDADGYVFERKRIEEHGRRLLDGMLRTVDDPGFSDLGIDAQSRLSPARPARPARKAVIIRAGEHGSLLLTARPQYPKTETASGLPRDIPTVYTKWFPTFNAISPRPVIDATGAGNTFLGAVAFTLAAAAASSESALDSESADASDSTHAAFEPSIQDLTTAIVNGTCAASFAIQQIGLPNDPFGSGFCPQDGQRGDIHRRDRQLDEDDMLARTSAYTAAIAAAEKTDVAP